MKKSKLVKDEKEHFNMRKECRGKCKLVLKKAWKRGHGVKGAFEKNKAGYTAIQSRTEGQQQ